jgi:phage/plasmid-associated DNA primase
MASGGDELEMRTNYKDEVRKRLQCTMFLCCNDFPPVEPADAYQTLEVFDFHSVFVPLSEIQARGASCPKHWKQEDPDIKQWIKRPDVLDAFTKIVLEAWTLDHLPVPQCVSQHTKQLNRSASDREFDR